MNIFSFSKQVGNLREEKIETLLDINKMLIKFPFAKGRAKLGSVSETVKDWCLY